MYNVLKRVPPGLNEEAFDEWVETMEKEGPCDECEENVDQE